MGLLNDYRESLAVLDGAHAKALSFASRMIHMEAARGWAAFQALYERVLELRVMLRRVANPRACGMLRLWSRLALERKEALQKMRRAYSRIANGTVTRLTTAPHLTRIRRLAPSPHP
tara:strand:- start:171 stop:521 length:351 start_codon:yes stop_codon:yes gene_type:complete